MVGAGLPAAGDSAAKQAHCLPHNSACLANGLVKAGVGGRSATTRPASHRPPHLLAVALPTIFPIFLNAAAGGHERSAQQHSQLPVIQQELLLGRWGPREAPNRLVAGSTPRAF